MIQLTRTPVSGLELGYAERTSDFTTTSTTLVDVTSLTTTVTVGTRPVMVIFFASSVGNNAANGGISIHVVEDSTDLGAVTGNLINSAGASHPATGFVRRSPSAGSHTYKITAKSILSGTTTISAGAGGAAANAAAFIQVVQI